MTEARFTPGPWTYSTHSDGWSYTIHIAQADDAAYTPDWSDVAFATCRGERQQIQEANARLIAAAPDLFDALYSVLWAEDKQPDHREDAIRHARAAVAKAVGEQA